MEEREDFFVQRPRVPRLNRCRMINTETLAWMEAARGGDEDAAARLVHQFHAPLYSFLRRLSGSESDAVELTQRAFCRAWKSIGTFAGRGTVSSWFHGIAYRTYVDWMRSEHRTEGRDDVWWDGLPDLGVTPDVATAAADSAAMVWAAVDRLEPGQREAVHLHYYQGLTLEETGEVLGIATSTVKYRIREALAQVQRDMDRMEQPRNHNISPLRRA